MYKLIVVDDEFKIRDGICNTIPWADCGVTVVATASNGMEALDKIRISKPDIVITDIYMEKMNGLELAVKTRQEYPEIKTIIISGYDDFEYARKAIEARVFSYVMKPILPDELMGIVRNVICEIEDGRKPNERIEKQEEDLKSDMNSDMKSVIKKAQEYILQNYQSFDISLLTIARHLFLSPAYFSNMYKEQTGESYVEFITKVRIDEARRLLRDTNQKIIDIACKVGYSNAKYFCTLFKKNTGLTPVEYREGKRI